MENTKTCAICSKVREKGILAHFPAYSARRKRFALDWGATHSLHWGFQISRWAGHPPPTTSPTGGVVQTPTSNLKSEGLPVYPWAGPAPWKSRFSVKNTCPSHSTKIRPRKSGEMFEGRAAPTTKDTTPKTPFHPWKVTKGPLWEKALLFADLPGMSVGTWVEHLREGGVASVFCLVRTPE